MASKSICPSDARGGARRACLALIRSRFCSVRSIPIFDDFSGGSGLLEQLQVAGADAEDERGGDRRRFNQFTAELPGLEPKDVDVTLSDNILHHPRREAGGEGREGQGVPVDGAELWLVLAFLRGSLGRRSLSAIKASIDKGVLHVSFPKPAQAESKKIEVKSARSSRRPRTQGRRRRSARTEQGGFGRPSARDRRVHRPPCRWALPRLFR